MAETTGTRSGLHLWGADSDTWSRTEVNGNFTVLETSGVYYLTGTRAGRPSAAAANAGWVYITSDTSQVFVSDGTNWISLTSARAYYGTGADGAATISSNTSATGPRFYTTLTVNSGVTLDMAGYPLYCTGAITCNGTIAWDGAAGSGATLGAGGGGAGILGRGGPGSAGGVNGTTPGSPVTGGNFSGAGGAPGQPSGSAQGNVSLYGGDGGYGGTGSSGNYGGATAYRPSAVTYDPTLLSLINNALAAHIEAMFPAGTFQRVDGGVGGIGGVAGAAANSGGGGGGGGGVGWVACPAVIGTGTVSARGGQGGAAPGTNAGGGGGGGGGVLYLIGCHVAGVTLTVAGGAGGAGTGTGTTGSAGATGRLIRMGGNV